MHKAALVAITLALVLNGASAFAQGPSQSGPQNPAMKSQDANNSGMPVKGANSFTMSEARSHIEGKGYTHVTMLKKDNAGVWRGMAMKDGQKVHVSLDYQGNVNTD
ncbi:MAG: PepSY domain-containing protein [Alphaproteobacteria bacterium]|nr:PepSY domain-containing protein [Alphaproteobacteria bacterium]